MFQMQWCSDPEEGNWEDVGPQYETVENSMKFWSFVLVKWLEYCAKDKDMDREESIEVFRKCNRIKTPDGCVLQPTKVEVTPLSEQTVH